MLDLMKPIVPGWNRGPRVGMRMPIFARGKDRRAVPIATIEERLNRPGIAGGYFV